MEDHLIQIRLNAIPDRASKAVSARQRMQDSDVLSFICVSRCKIIAAAIHLYT
jgi:hypothetical protein